MKIGSLFSGAGGLDMAVEAVFGGEVVWQSEVDKAASTVLGHRFPGVPNLGDITQIDFRDVEKVDILCGGFPCQDVSAAGKRAGIKAGTRSGLWALFANAIDVVRPRLVVIENVRGLLSARAHRNLESADPAVGDDTGGPVLRAAGAVLGDLADLGYDAQWTTLAAADVGAPHRRERVFIVAADTKHAGSHHETDDARWRESHIARRSGWSESEGFGAASCCGPLAVDRHVELLPMPTAVQGRNETSGRKPGSKHNSGTTLNDVVFKGDIGNLLPTPSTHDKTGARSPDTIAKMRKPFSNLNDTAVNELLSTPQARDSKGAPSDDYNQACLPRDIIECDTAWGKYEPAIRGWESLTRPAPKPTEPGVSGMKRPRLNAAFSEWMMGWPAGWVTDPDIGISRNDQLRIVGNGVCPQQAVAALRLLLTVSEVAA